MAGVEVDARPAAVLLQDGDLFRCMKYFQWRPTARQQADGAGRKTSRPGGLIRIAGGSIREPLCVYGLVLRRKRILDVFHAVPLRHRPELTSLGQIPDTVEIAGIIVGVVRRGVRRLRGLRARKAERQSPERKMNRSYSCHRVGVIGNSSPVDSEARY